MSWDDRLRGSNVPTHACLPAQSLDQQAWRRAFLLLCSGLSSFQRPGEGIGGMEIRDPWGFWGWRMDGVRSGGGILPTKWFPLFPFTWPSWWNCSWVLTYDSDLFIWHERYWIAIYCKTSDRIFMRHNISIHTKSVELSIPCQNENCSIYQHITAHDMNTANKSWPSPQQTASKKAFQHQLAGAKEPAAWA